VNQEVELPDNERRRITRDGVSLAFTVGLYGTAFGAAASSSGLSPWQALALSALLFSGASQFAVVGVGVITSWSLAVTAITGALLLGTRNALYGLRMAPILQVRGFKRVAAAQITIDESTGIAISQEHLGLPAMRHGFWVTGLGVYVFWNSFTLLGALGADALGDPAQFGLDAAVPAAFLGLLWPRLKGRTPWAVGMAAAITVLILLPHAPVGVPVITSALAAVVAGWKSGGAK